MAYKKIELSPLVHQQERPAPAAGSSQGQGRGLLNWATNEILQAPDGDKHSTLIKVAYTLGGHVGFGTLSRDEAIETCDSAINARQIISPKAARKTIEDGIREGMAHPITPQHAGYSERPRQPRTAQPEPQPQKTPAEIYEALQAVRFNSSEPIEKPDAVISIDEHIISTRGNVTTIAGQAKAGKSALISAILAGSLTMPGDVQPDLLGFTIKRNDTAKAVLHVDGEQSRYDHYKGMSRLLGRAARSTEPEWFHSYNFRVLDIPERINSLRLLAEAVAEKHGGIHMIVLDGGADFVLDTNDLKESNEVVKFFETLAIEFECPVVIVLHFNPGSEKGRGHFGSQLERKSESVLSVSKDKESEVSTVEGKFLRNSGNIPNLQFIYDTEKGHHVYHGTKSHVGRSEQKAARLKEVAEAIFRDGASQFTYTELCAKISIVTGLKERSAKSYVRDMLTQKVIEHSEDLGKLQLKKQDGAEVQK